MAVNFKYLCTIICSLIILKGFAQNIDPVRVNIVPTNNIYKVFFDHDGYMWIGSDLGLVRYDGTNTIIIKPYKINTGIRSIIQDDSGRIWCMGEDHSAYYVKDGQLKLIKPAKRGEWVHSLMSYRGKVYLTTTAGLSVYDIANLSYRQYKVNLEVAFGTDIFNSGGFVFVFNHTAREALLFTGTSFKKIEIPGLGKHLSIFFQESTGTVFYTHLPSYFKKEVQNIYQLNYIDGKFQVLKKITWKGSLINSVSPTSRIEYWINARDGSESSNHQVYRGYNVHEVVTDKEGNNWFVSLNGLSVKYKSAPVKNVESIKEKIFSIAKKGSYFYLGATGKVFKYDIQKQQIINTIPIPEWSFEVGFLKYLSGNEFVVQSGSLNYFFNDSTTKFRELGGATFVNNAVQFGDEVYLASDLSSYYNIHNPKAEDITLVPKQLIYKYCNNCLLTLSDVAVIPDKNKIILAADSNLNEFSPGSFNHIKYNKEPIIASALLYLKPKLYIATARFGILTYENHLISQLIPPENLGPEIISKIRVVGNNLWLISPGAVKLLNIKTGRLVKNDITGDYIITDVVTENDQVYFISSNKLYNVNLHSDTRKRSLICKNDFTVINGTDTVYSNTLTFKHDQNDLQFNLSYPVFSSPEKTRFKYRLTGTNDSKWKLTNSIGGIVRFASLMPGQYTLEAFALHPNLGDSDNTIRCKFLILPPWWNTWIFKTGITILALILTGYLIGIYYNSKLLQQKTFFENELAIEKERQRISREIHDDIGQSLSVIKLNLSMGGPAQLLEAKIIIADVIKELRELTHNLYHSRTLANDLITSIQMDVDRLNVADQVQAVLEFNQREASLTQEQELTIYRIYQEAINNILKHAESKHIKILLHFAGKKFEMIIRDDGKGFVHDTKTISGIGISSMQKRADEAGGKLLIVSKIGAGTEIRFFIE